MSAMIPSFIHMSALESAPYSRPAVSIRVWFDPKYDCGRSPMFLTDRVRMMNSPCGFAIMNGLLGSPACAARCISSTRNSNLPSRTADPAGATDGVAEAGAVLDDVDGRDDVELLLSSPLPHLPTPNRISRTTATITHAAPLPEPFLTAVGACGAAQP